MNSDYVKFKHLCSKEDFFVSYAVRGPIIYPRGGIRQGLPVRHPINGPVNEPSPLNAQYYYEKRCNYNDGIF